MKCLPTCKCRGERQKYAPEIDNTSDLNEAEDSDDQ